MADAAIAIEEACETAVTYSDYIKKAFIEPIRSVTVVDDEYPTLDGLIEYYNNSSKIIENTIPKSKDSENKKDVESTSKELSSWEGANIDQLEALIGMCREQDTSWSIDVYDGKKPHLGNDSEYTPHINHSDLLILDYHLDTEGDDGKRSRNILSGLATNNHYNLVIVHTKGHEGDIDTAYTSILKDFIKLPSIPLPTVIGKKYNTKKIDEIDDSINEWFDENDPDDELKNKLFETIEIKILLDFLKKDNCINQVKAPGSPVNSWQDDVSKISNATQLSPSYINWWLLNNHLSNHFENIDENDYGVISWKYDKDVNWIATGRVFITVVEKKSEIEKIKELNLKLVDALIEYNPSPMLLLMARMRYELDENGIEAANIIASDIQAQAGWLYQFVADRAKNDFICDNTINIHWDMISDATKSSLIEFTTGIADVLCNGDRPKDIVKLFFGGKVINDHVGVISRVNAYSCSKPVKSIHLTTGHVFVLQDNGIKEYWVCLTPACDMVPGQKVKGWYERLGLSNIPFKAVKIKRLDGNNTAVSNANDNNYLFLNIDGEIESFEYPRYSTSPEWEVMIVEGNGLINNRKINIRRIGMESETPLSITDSKEAQVVSELRYEYALNLLQRLGANQSRVGLGFVNELW